MKWYISNINQYSLQDEEAKHDLEHIQEKLVGKLVHIGKTPPDNKDILWIDTRNFFDDEANIDNIPTFIDTELIQYIVQMVSALARRVNTLETEVIILKRQIAEGGGGGGTDGELNPRYTYLVTEDGFYLATEEGECFVLEQENNVAGGTDSELDSKYTYLVTEDNRYLATEEGKCFVLEQENK